jgi:type IV pilus assembly protein PilC
MSNTYAEYRIDARDSRGKPVQGIINASSYLEARRKAKSLAGARKATLIAIHRKKNYSYRVRRGSKVIDGYQSAYSRDEVVNALKRMGFEVRSVRRLLDFRSRAASGELVSFISTSARLLEQKFLFNEVLETMAANVTDKSLKAALREILNDLKNGSDSREAFLKQRRVFGEHIALMLAIASKSGDMKSIFRSIALLVERQADFKKGLVSSLILPGVTSLTLVGAIAFYAIVLLPNMAEIMGPMVSQMPPLTAFTLEVSYFIREHLVALISLIVLATAGAYAYLLSPSGRLKLDQYIVRVPYIGRIMKNTTVEIFCRVLGIMYTSGENIDAIQLAAESSGNRHLAKQIKTVAIPSMLKYGTEFSRAMEATHFFPELFLSRFKTASETGTIKDTALQVADYYQTENQYSMKNLVSFIEVSITMVIMLTMVFLTVLSSETATIDMKPKGAEQSSVAPRLPAE